MDNEEKFWRMVISTEILELIEKDHEVNAYGVYLFVKNGPKNSDS